MTTIEFLRQFRIVDYAVFDFVVSFLGMYLLSFPLSKLFLKLRVIVPKQNWLYLTLPLAILVHVLFNTYTPMTRNFFDPIRHFVVKFVIICSFILGIKGIKIFKQQTK